ncbi:helix-turn-helix domain-containing protein [Cohnella abietis]|nr:AraC family transcriptional regulator [Cohnella abietis]
MLSEFARKAEAANSLTIQAAQKELRKLVDAVGDQWSAVAAVSPLLSDHGAIDGVMSLPSLIKYVSQLSSAIERQIGARSTPEAANPMREIAAYLDEHFFEDVGLIDVATRYHMDPSHLSRQFKSVTGENFIEYVTRKRMEKACELLRESDRKINDIAELVGYENQRYFSQVFKKFTGLTPSEYRESPAPVSPSAKN